MLSAAQKHVGVQSGGSGALTQAQIEAMLAGEDEEEAVPAEPAAPQDSGSAEEKNKAKQEAPKAEIDEDTAIADRLREGINADAQAAADETEEKARKKKEKKPKEKKEKKPLDKGTIAKILTVAAVIVAAALGYCICLLCFTDVFKSANEEFSIKAAKAVSGNLPAGSEMYFYKAYVRNGVSSDECMLYAVTSSEKKANSEKTDMYRVVINRDEPNKINVYYTLDTDNPEYINMVESGDLELRIKASNLKNYSDSIYAADKEIQINSPSWEKIDCNIINKELRPAEETTSAQ